MAKMELGAKANCKRYEQSTPTKKKAQKPRTVKISDEKKALFECILHNLDQCKGLSLANVQVLKENKLISVQIGNKTFKIDIIEQRPPKK
jgi:peptide deformylase